MKLKIRNWKTGREIANIACKTMREGIADTVRTHKDLSYAYLPDLDIRGTSLTNVKLHAAYLTGMNAYNANLRWVDFSKSDLSRSQLARSDLRNADLRQANLRDCNLLRADLRGADLRGANLRRTCFRECNLEGARGFVAERCTPLMMLREQVGPLRAYKLVNECGEGSIHGGRVYEIGKQYEVNDASQDPFEHYGSGIHLATLDWCIEKWRPGQRILVAEFLPADISGIPAGGDGKFRVYRCRFLDELQLRKLGLTECDGYFDKLEPIIDRNGDILNCQNTCSD